MPEKCTANAILYADIKGFTRTLDDLDQDRAASAELNQYFAAWESLRNALVRPKDPLFRRDYYLANRVGDAFIIFIFHPDPKNWFFFISEYLQKQFKEFVGEVQTLIPNYQSHLKTTLCTSAEGLIPYFQTDPIPERLMGKKTISRRDFISNWINICARIDGLDEADDFQFLCNAPAFQKIAKSCSEEVSMMFVDLGKRKLRGVSKAEHIFGFHPLQPEQYQTGSMI